MPFGTISRWEGKEEVMGLQCWSVFICAVFVDQEDTAMAFAILIIPASLL